MIATDNIAQRGQAYTALVEMVRRRGSGALHNQERELLFDAADALLFGEEEAADKSLRAKQMISELAESGRWTEEAAESLKDQLTLIA